jgi:hypothetical protein
MPRNLNLAQLGHLELGAAFLAHEEDIEAFDVFRIDPLFLAGAAGGRSQGRDSDPKNRCSQQNRNAYSKEDHGLGLMVAGFGFWEADTF